MVRAARGEAVERAPCWYVGKRERTKFDLLFFHRRLPRRTTTTTNDDVDVDDVDLSPFLLLLLLLLLLPFFFHSLSPSLMKTKPINGKQS